jgi:hypothetical protein
VNGAGLLELIEPINLLVVLNVLGELLLSEQEVLFLPLLLAVLVPHEIFAPLMLQETVIVIIISVTDVIGLKDVGHEHMGVCCELSLVLIVPMSEIHIRQSVPV